MLKTKCWLVVGAGPIGSEVIIKKLRQAIESRDEKVIDILKEVYIDRSLEKFITNDFPALIWGEIIWEYGWLGFRNAKEYIGFIDELYKEYAFRNVDIWSEVVATIEQEIEEFLPAGVAAWYKENYGKSWKNKVAWDYLESIKEQNNLAALIDWVAPVVEKHQRDGIINVASYWWNKMFSPERFEDFLTYAEPKKIIELANKYGYYEDLVVCLTF